MKVKVEREVLLALLEAKLEANKKAVETWEKANEAERKKAEKQHLTEILAWKEATIKAVSEELERLKNTSPEELVKTADVFGSICGKIVPRMFTMRDSVMNERNNVRELERIIHIVEVSVDKTFTVDDKGIGWEISRWL